MVRLASLSILAFATALTACTRDPAVAETRVGSPVIVVRAFISAVNSQDKETLLSLLTPPARKNFEASQGFRIEEARFDNATIGKAIVAASEAQVPVEAGQDGEKHHFVILLRREESWFVRGIEIALAPDLHLTINFEEFDPKVSAIAEGLGESLQAEFEKAARDAAEGGSAEEIAQKKRQFEAIRKFGSGDDAFLWTNLEDFRGRSAGEAVRRLARELDLEVHLGEHAENFRQTVTADLPGLSRLEAIEVVSTELDLYPVYPSVHNLNALGGTWSGALQGMLDPNADPAAAAVGRTPALVFARGARPWPVEFTGPFLVEVENLVEHVPHATGQVHLAIKAYGLDPGLLTLIGDLDETTVIEAVTNRTGQSLTSDEAVRYLGGRVTSGTWFESTLSIDLKNLLRDVGSVDRLAGVQRLVMPRQLETVELANPVKGQRAVAGELRLTVEETGESTSFEIEGPESLLEKIVVRFWAEDEQGNDLGILYQNVLRWGSDRVQASLETPQPPAKIVCKLIPVCELLDCCFELGPIPIARHAEMPEKIEPLSFQGSEAPLAVDFVGFKDRDSDFPTALFSVVNVSNKDVVTVLSRFLYVDVSGTKLEEISHTFSAPFATHGPEPLAVSGRSSETEATAFFMPKRTESVLVEVERVEFIDGTVWEKSF